MDQQGTKGTIEDHYRIVVGDDLATTGNEALEQAAALGRRLGNAELHVVHVLSRPSARNAGVNDRRLEDALRTLKDRVGVVLARDPSLGAHAHVRFGRVAEAIIQVAIDHDADVILVGTHGRRGVERVRSRSVAERLVRTAPLPVLVAHAKDFTRLPTTSRPEPARPGATLHVDQKLSEVVIAPAHATHIAGLV